MSQLFSWILFFIFNNLFSHPTVEKGNSALPQAYESISLKFRYNEKSGVDSSTTRVWHYETSHNDEQDGPLSCHQFHLYIWKFIRDDSSIWKFSFLYPKNPIKTILVTILVVNNYSSLNREARNIEHILYRNAKNLAIYTEHIVILLKKIQKIMHRRS